MAAYGALVSVMQIIDQLHRHPHPPITLDQTQSQSLTANIVTTLQEFQEAYNPRLTYTSQADPFDGSLRGSSCLPDYDPVSDDHKGKVVLENIHTLGEVSNLKLDERVLRTISNIKHLMLCYSERSTIEQRGDYYFLNNLHRLNKLQHLHLIRYGWGTSLSMQELVLPYSLKKLSLKRTDLPWEEMASKIGWLPLLQVLELEYDAFVGSEWETVEGQSPSLEFLKIEECDDLEYWITASTHFPRLKHLVLHRLKRLREIPSSIGDIPTLESVKLEYCGDSMVESARRIVEEQEELGNEDIQLQVIKSTIFN